MENNTNNDEMKIPEHCSQTNEIVEGFGKIELFRSAIFMIIGLIIGIFLMAIWTKELPTVVLSTVIGGGFGYVFCKKDRYSRQSVIDILLDFRRFKNSQKYYEYRR